MNAPYEPMPPPERHQPDLPPPTPPDAAAMPPSMPPDGMPFHSDFGFDPSLGGFPQQMPDLHPEYDFNYQPSDAGYFPPDSPPMDSFLQGLGDPYGPPEHPGFVDSYYPPDPPAFDTDLAGLTDPPGLVPDAYVPPDPPAFDAGVAGVTDPYRVPDPAGLVDSYQPPDPPVFATSTLTPPTADTGEAHLQFNFDLSEHFAEHGSGPATFQIGDLGALYNGVETVRTVEIHQGDQTYWVSASIAEVRDGIVTINIGIGGDRATIVMPAVAADVVTIKVEPSKDPQKVADVTVSAPLPVAMDVHSSRDVTIVSTVPFGPPTPAEPPPVHHGEHHQDSHKAEQPTSPAQPPTPQQPAGQPQPPAEPSPTPAPASPLPPDPPPASPQPDLPPTPDHPPFDPSLLPPLPHLGDPNAPTLADLLRTDPPKTVFEEQLGGGQAFGVPVRVHSEVDVSTVAWLNRPPADFHHTRFEVVGDPTAKVTADEGTFELTVDPAAVMAVRDPQTKELLGYRMRRGETMFTFDRDGRLTGAGNLETPLQQPAVDPIDVMMVAVDIGPIVGRGLAASVDAAAAAFVKQAPKAAAEFTRGPTIARFSADEVAELGKIWQEQLAKETDPGLRKQAEQALKALVERTRVRDWQQSEREVAHLYKQIGGKAESAETYVNAAGEVRITKPDFSTSSVRGEVKNWEILHIRSDESANKMLDRLVSQVKARQSITPYSPKQQTLVLDLRGQALTEEHLHTLGHVLAERTGLPVENIQLIVWAK